MLENIQQYVGGQVEIQNPREGYLFRGEIAKAEVRDNTLILSLAWMARAVGYPPMPSHWQLDDERKIYAASLFVYETKNIGPGQEGGDRIALSSVVTGELTVLYPPDGSKLAKPG